MEKGVRFYMDISWEILKLWHNEGPYKHIEESIFLGQLAYLCKAVRDLFLVILAAGYVLHVWIMYGK